MRRLRIVSGFGFIWILVCFGPRGLFRYSDFGFMSPGYWHRKFVEVGLFNISKIRILTGKMKQWKRTELSPKTCT